MYSTSSSSSSQQSTPPNPTNNNDHIMRYGSAPSSFLSTMAESVTSGLGHQQHQHQHQPHFFGACSSSQEANKNTLTVLQDSYVMTTNNSPVKSSSSANNNNTASSHLFRHSSSPAGFLDHLTAEIGYSKGIDQNYENQGQGGNIRGHKQSRLGSQMSFTQEDHHHGDLSKFTDVNECMLEGISSHDNNLKRSSSTTQPRLTTTGFSISSWDNSSNTSFNFSGSSTKRSKNIDDDILNGFGATLDSQQEITFEMASMDRLMQIPQDSVPCKIRAKRGFATHPRSIAERERRTRISGKLKRLQELVPNMDKQTSYADMLDLAVQHIKGLQTHIQKLRDDLDRCTCGCKQNMQG